MSRHDPTLSRHATERIVEMGLDVAQVIEVIVEPEIEYQQGDYTGRVAQRGDLSVVIDEHDGETVVVTVLPRTQEVYER